MERADYTKEHMGLTTWADAPEGKIKKSDVTVAKNYLSQDEMKQLNRMVTAYLDFAENMTLRHIPLTMRYVSAEEAWESYKKDVFQGNEELLEGFEGNNPLKESDSYEITLKEVKSYKQVVSHLETIDGVRKVRYSEGAAEGMMKINTMGTYLAGGIILILMAVSIFLVSNTVSIGVAVREEEISIMKLIGAANGFIKAPFQAEGMIIGILGSLIPTAIIFAGYEGIINWMNDKFHVVTVFMKFVPIQQIMLYLLPLALLVGIVIGLLGSSITIRKYLKV